MNEDNIEINKKLLLEHSLMNKIELKQFNHLYNKYIFGNKRKSSFDFTKKKFNIKDSEKDIGKSKRKYKIKKQLLSIKGFVPTLKPIERKISPSKLLLNKKDKSHFHKSNLNDNSNCISCPNSEEEEDSEYNSSQNLFFFYSNINNDNDILNEDLPDKLRKPSIKDERKNLHRTKNNNNNKSYSRQHSLIKENLENKFNLDFSAGSDLEDEILDDYIQLRKVPNDKNNVNNNDSINNKDKLRNRINSCSILTMLQKKFKLGE